MATSITERPHVYSFSGNEIRYILNVTDPTTPGCAVDIELYYYNVGDSVGILFKSFTLTPGADGNIYCYLDDYLQALLKPELPLISGPLVQLVRDQVKLFYIRYREITTAVPAPDWISDHDNVQYVIMGGVEKMKFKRNNFFVTYLPASKAFLTWQPANRMVFADEMHYLTYLHTDGFDFKVKIHTVFTDGTINDMEIDQVVAPDILFRIKAGATDLGLHLIAPTKQLYYYEIQIVRNPGGVVLANSYRYYIEYRYLYSFTDIVFFNSLGGFDSVRVKGEVSWSIENNGDDIEHITGNEAYDTDRPQPQYSQINQLKRDDYKGDAGWCRTPDQQEALVELLVSKGRYVVVDGRWIGIVNLKKNMDLRLTTDKKWSFPIEWSYGYSDAVFTPKAVMLGDGS